MILPAVVIMKPNMTISEFNDWLSTIAFDEYRSYRGPQQVDSVVSRTERVLKGESCDDDRDKVRRFIDRMSKQPAGEQRFGEGQSQISARTAALKNWGYDPTK